MWICSKTSCQWSKDSCRHSCRLKKKLPSSKKRMKFVKLSLLGWRTWLTIFQSSRNPWSTQWGPLHSSWFSQESTQSNCGSLLLPSTLKFCLLYSPRSCLSSILCCTNSCTFSLIYQSNFLESSEQRVDCTTRIRNSDLKTILKTAWN